MSGKTDQTELELGKRRVEGFENAVRAIVVWGYFFEKKGLTV